MFFPFLFSFSICYPFYIENTGKEYGIPGEDINIISAWKEGLSGKGIKMHFIGNDVDPNNSAIIDNFNIENSRIKSENINEHKIIGTALVSVALGKWNNSVYGIANNSKFSFTTPNKKADNISSFFNDLSIETKGSDIIIDYSTTCEFRWKDPSTIYYRKKIKELSSYIDNKVLLGRSYKGSILISPSLTLSQNMMIKTSIYEPYDENILVGTSDFIGGPSFTPYYSTATLINAPNSGNSDLTYNCVYPRFDLIKDDPEKESIKYYPFSCAIVAGAAALILEKNPNLSYRDLQYILALSASKNDPTHPYWITNAAGFNYNPLYGFGRINVAEAVRISEFWTSANLPTCDSYTCDSKMNNVDIPYARTGQLNLEFDIHTKEDYAFTESVFFNFMLSEQEISMLRIIVTSPLGTKIEILKPNSKVPTGYPHEHSTSCPYQILMRCFLGENPNGKWKVTIIDNAFLVGKKLVKSSLTVKAMSECPSFPKIKPHKTSKSLYPLKLNEDRFTISIDNPVVLCNRPYKVTVQQDNSSIYSPLFLLNNKSGRMIPIPNPIAEKGKMIITIPCLYESTENMSIVAQKRDQNMSNFVNIKYENNFTISGIAFPDPYLTIPILSEKTYVKVRVINQKKDFSPFAPGPDHIITLYNLETNKIIFQDCVNLDSNHFLIFPLPRMNPRKGLIVVTPIDPDVPDPCNTFITPITFNVDKKHVEDPFAIPLNDYCPIPYGIKVTVPEPSNKVVEWFSSTEGISITIIVVLTIVAVIVLFAFICKKYICTTPPSPLDDQLLL